VEAGGSHVMAGNDDGIYVFLEVYSRPSQRHNLSAHNVGRQLDPPHSPTEYPNRAAFNLI
jgi:hypothetical protein